MLKLLLLFFKKQKQLKATNAYKDLTTHLPIKADMSLK